MLEQSAHPTGLYAWPDRRIGSPHWMQESQKIQIDWLAAKLFVQHTAEVFFYELGKFTIDHMIKPVAESAAKRIFSFAEKGALTMAGIDGGNLTNTVRYGYTEKPIPMHPYLRQISFPDDRTPTPVPKKKRFRKIEWSDESSVRKPQELDIPAAFTIFTLFNK